MEDGTKPLDGASFDIATNFMQLRGRLEHRSTFGPGGVLVQYDGTILRATAVGFEQAQHPASKLHGIINEVSGFTNPAANTFVAERTSIRFRKGINYNVEIIAGRTDLPFVSAKFFWSTSAVNNDEPNNKLVVYEVDNRQWYITDSGGVPQAADPSLNPNPDVNGRHFTQKGSASGSPEAVMYPTGTLTLSPLDITEVISDQIPGNNANKLPTPFYKTTNNPMLMATRADGLAYLRYNVNSIMPQAVLSATKLRVGVRHMLRSGSTVIPDPATLFASIPTILPSTTAISFTPIASASDTVRLYQVVFGQDFDADGQLQQTETVGVFAKTPLKDSAGKDYTTNKERRDLIKLVTAADIAFSTAKLKGDRVIYNFLNTYAKHLLDSFISGTTAGVTGATFTTGHTINALQNLGHPVGGNWNALNNELTHKFTFGTTSEPTLDYKSSGYLEERIKQVVEANLAAIKAAAPIPYDTPAFISFAADASLSFPIKALDGLAKKQLGAAFGKCELVNATVLLRVTHKDRFLPGPD